MSPRRAAAGPRAFVLATWLALLGGAALSLQASCVPPKPVGSPNGRVARGELYKPGLVAYDEYFISVHEVQVEMAGAPDDRKAARSALAQALGLLPNVPTERMVQVLKERAAELRKAGGRFVVNGVSAQADKGTADDRTVAQGLSSCLAGERSVIDRMAKMPERTDSMLQIAATLDGSVDADFNLGQRAQVKNELSVSKQVLRTNTELARSNVRSGERFIEELVVAATGAKLSATPAPTVTATATAPAPSPPAHKPAVATPRKPGPAAPAAPATTPAPAPPKPPDDFNP